MKRFRIGAAGAIDLAWKMLARFGLAKDSRSRKSYAKRNQAIFSDLGWHERMLADRVRVEAYRNGLSNVVPAGATVVELGTGTGILAMLAANAGAGRVIAIDHSSIVNLASTIASHNGILNIEFLRLHSSELKLVNRADLIIHEQMGHEIFGEHMVENLLELKRRVLKQNGRIEPGRFRLFAAPVSLNQQYRRPFVWEVKDSQIDYSFLRDHEVIKEYIGDRYARRLIKNFEVESLLASPQSVLEFDLNEIGSQADIKPLARLDWRIEKEGQVDGILFFFQTWFGDGTTFDTSPTSIQTNWDCPMLRVPQQAVSVDDNLSCDLSLMPLTDWWSWKVSALSVH